MAEIIQKGQLKPWDGGGRAQEFRNLSMTHPWGSNVRVKDLLGHAWECLKSWLSLYSPPFLLLFICLLLPITDLLLSSPRFLETSSFSGREHMTFAEKML